MKTHVNKKTVVEQLQDKVKYYETMERKFMKTYIQDGKRPSRDTAIKCGERVVAYSECLEMLQGIGK